MGEHKLARTDKDGLWGGEKWRARIETCLRCLDRLSLLVWCTAMLHGQDVHATNMHAANYSAGGAVMGMVALVAGLVVPLPIN